MDSLTEFIINHFWAISASILTISFGGYVAYRNNRINRTVAASATFRSAIDPESFKGMKGHILHGALIQAFPIFKAAVHEYRISLGWFDRFRLNRAWKKYHGGNEKYPEMFKPYCIKENGPELLKHRLSNLKKIGEKN